MDDSPSIYSRAAVLHFLDQYAESISRQRDTAMFATLYKHAAAQIEDLEAEVETLTAILEIEVEQGGQQ